MREPTTRYANEFMDSARWEEITLREGDIVISTPPKCGTTWAQMICALLIFQTPELPRPLDDLSPWVDLLTRTRAELRHEYESQQHRRFFKTHTPLSGLPYDDRVTYLCVARDPRDAAVSWDHHVGNMDFAQAMALREAVAAADGLATEEEEAASTAPTPESPVDRFWAWVDHPGPMTGLSWMLAHLSEFWQIRDRANVLLLRYEELRADLAAQLPRIAATLGIEVPQHRWPELVAAARFDAMKQRADALAPEGRIWHDRGAFFHRGTTGQWREVLDGDGSQRYADRVAQLADPELARWVHGGALSSVS